MNKNCLYYKWKKYITQAFLVLFMAVVVIITVYPIIYAFFGAFKTNSELLLGKAFLPVSWHLKNFVDAFQKANFLLYTKNSLMISAMVMLLAVSTCALAGYVFGRKEFPGKKMLLSLYTGLMFIALGSVTLYPVYTVLKTMGLHKSLLGLALALTGGQASNVLLVTGFVKNIPKELDEAAIIDGCGPFQLFFRVIMPLLRPILAVVAIFSFRNSWNDYTTSLIFTMSNKAIRPLTVAVVQLKYGATAAAEWNIMLAGTCIAIIPILIVYVICHRQFIGGLTGGAIKG